jgi:A/G-specific adenine glycosylase
VPWAILVAEFCCQQTQAQRAIAAYERCRSRFPTPAACADAPLRDVLEAWRGLGYYRRARALHEAAKVIVERHGGVVPDELASLLALPGVGPYTARAVLAFAFERDVGVVDTNVARVLARAVANRPLAPQEAQRLADALVPPGRGWAHNQAMLDLGATACGPTALCEHCVLRPSCAWHRAGRPGPDPAVRTAFASRPQARFKGSDREGRGRLLAAALDAPVAPDALAEVAGWPGDPARARRIADELVEEGLLELDDGDWRVAAS